MRKITAILGFVLLFVGTCPASGPIEPEVDYAKAITQIKLMVPQDADVRASLGIQSKGGQFMLSDMDAEVIIIEIFSMYCPYCQKHAPTANKLFQAIEEGTQTRGKVKLIGVGVGNSLYEVNFFRKKYNIPFPLFDDRNSAVLNSLSGVRTPYYFGIRKKGKSLNVFFSQQGPYDDARLFLQTVLSKSGLPQ